MSTVYKWKVWCVTDSKWEENIWSETTPTKCPTDPINHTISTVSIEDTREPNVVSVNVEGTPTQGYFGFEKLIINAAANTTTETEFWFDIPINVSSAIVTTEETHRNDTLTWIVEPNTTIGALTANVTANAAWTSQNYVVDDLVYYSVTKRNYKCIVNTTSNQVPTNRTYWQFQPNTLHVSGTVTTYIKLGFNVRLTDGVHTDDLGKCSSFNAATGIITTAFGSTHDYSAYSPTYVQMNITYFNEVTFGPPMTVNIGGTYGCSYLPAGMRLVAFYTNPSNVDKTLVAFIQIKY